MELKTKKNPFVLFNKDDAHLQFEFKAYPKSKIARCEQLCTTLAWLLVSALMVYELTVCYGEPRPGLSYWTWQSN